MEHIDRFVKDRGLTGKLTTPLQIIGDILDAAEEAILESEEVRAEAELLRRQKRILIQLRTKYRSDGAGYGNTASRQP